jgi:hypothetical protein
MRNLKRFLRRFRSTSFSTESVDNGPLADAAYMSASCICRRDAVQRRAGARLNSEPSEGHCLEIDLAERQSGMESLWWAH